MSSLYIDKKGIELEADGEALVFRENGVRIGTVPLAPLSRVFLRGDVRLQSSLLGKLGERGIGVIILSGRKAEPTLLMARPHNDAAKRLAQYQASQDTQFCLEFARNVVNKKIASQNAYLSKRREQDFQHRYELTLALRKLETAAIELKQKSSIAALRGAEGAAAAGYFQGIAAIAPPRLKFHQRNRRPPRDPLNAMMSLGYTLLHSEAVLSLYGAGLDPFIGFYHQIDFGRESLACDIVEPLRVEIDKFCLEQFKQETIRVEDFTNTESGCILGKNGRSKFYVAWEGMLEKIRKQLDIEITNLIATLSRLASTKKNEQTEEIDEK